MDPTNKVLSEKSQAKKGKYYRYSVQMKFKIRQNYQMVIDIKTVITQGGRGW